MSATAIVGANWGDEGKGKLTDVLAAQSDLVVRYQGGSNAGHTIINEHGKFALHLLPSGVFYPHVTNVLGPGVAVNVPYLLREYGEICGRGIPAPRLVVSDRAQLVLPHHLLFDAAEEDRLGARKFGSTRAGIAPFYTDKYAKLGIQAADLYAPDRLRARITQSLEAKNVLLRHLYGREPLCVDAVIEEVLSWADGLAPFLADTTELMHDAVASGKEILLEGQLGALRDPDYGIYPYSTSSSPLAGNGSIGAGVPPHAITRIIAVTKAYSSCVGTGPFVTEIFDEDAHELRQRGGDAGEYGATTGRPRRMGWFDAVATRYGCRVQGATEVALTNLDVLGYLDEIPVCTAYEVDGNSTGRFPVPAKLDGARPILETHPGWKCDLREVRRYEDLPTTARDYVERLERLIDTPIRWISIGPRREEIIVRTP